jgi:hypothetical protein
VLARGHKAKNEAKNEAEYEGVVDVDERLVADLIGRPRPFEMPFEMLGPLAPNDTELRSVALSRVSPQ